MISNHDHVPHLTVAGYLIGVMARIWMWHAVRVRSSSILSVPGSKELLEFGLWWLLGKGEPGVCVHCADVGLCSLQLCPIQNLRRQADPGFCALDNYTPSIKNK
jgi:hypothetical protein